MAWTSALVLAALHGASDAAPYVAYIGNVSVHSASPAAKIMVADLAGGAPVSVSEGLHSARSPAWSPDGALLAFEAIEEGLNDIFICRPDGSERRNITASPDAWESAPAFVDTNRIAYLSGPDVSDVWLLDLATNEKTKLTEETRFHGTPVASPDGTLLAVTGSDKLAGPGHIYLLATDGQETRQLTEAPAIYSTPCFSPDRESVAFCFDGAEVGGATRGLALVPVAGGEAQLVADNGYPLAPLSFSPDASRIAYTSSSVYHSTWVNVVNVDGSDSTRLAVNPFHIIGWPSFSPDGTEIAYRGVYGARYTVHVVDLATGEDVTLTPEGETGVNPVFSPR
jgi:TolB protein